MSIAYHVSITCFPWLHCNPEHGESGNCVVTPSCPRTPYSLTEEEEPYFPLSELARSTNNNKNDGDDNNSNININDIMITV